jgi:hypothetical protein
VLRLGSSEDLPERLRPNEGWRHYLEAGEDADSAWHRYLCVRRQRADARAWCADNGVDYRREYLNLLHPEWFGLPRRGPLFATLAEVDAYRRRAGLPPLSRR